MSKSAIGYIFSFIILVLLQVSVFNRIALFGYATPFLFLYFILKLPTTLSANWTMTLSFLMGLGGQLSYFKTACKILLVQGTKI